MNPSQLDLLWIIFCAALVFIMQAGFLALESGLTRSKNNINVALKNLADFGITTLIFWGFGFALMFGRSANGWWGTSRFLLDTQGEAWLSAFFLFEVMFCGTAVTILSGAVAERMRFGAYLIAALVVSGLLYPLLGHWAWNGADLGVGSGWLAKLGFVDFAGSTVVHSLGGWTALALLLIIGPRYGRFDETGEHLVPPANIPLATLGVLLLWLGWIGFNGGSTLALDGRVPAILFNTMLAGASGMTTGILYSRWHDGQTVVGQVINGALAGLVAITANAHVVSGGSAIIIGIMGCIVMLATERLLIRWQIDDAVGAIPVHLGAGIWGTLAVGIFGQPELLGTGLSRLLQTAVQASGVMVAGAWAFGSGWLIFTLVNRVYALRVSLEDEKIGLNVSEHGASTEMLELFQIMEQQAQIGNLDLRVPIEPFTEVGQIAQRYNAVITALQQSTKRNETIVSTARDGILTITADNRRITSLNPAAESILGYHIADIIGRPLSMVIMAPTDVTLEELLKESLLRESYVETTGKRANGEIFPLELAITRADIKEQSLYACVFRDITLRKSDELAVTEARDRALEANRIKSEFLASVSHELRTPINAVLGLAEMVELGVYGDVSEKQRKVMQQIIESGDSLESMVNELLDQAQLEAGAISYKREPFRPANLLKHVENTLGVIAQTKGVLIGTHLDKALPAVLMGDEKRLKQILLNLVGNSVKFTDEGSIYIYLNREDDANWRMRVEDTGIGIPETSFPYVFDAFHQSSEVMTREYGGVGLGLSIAQKLTNLMDGKISFSSEVGVGTTFVVSLPLEEADDQAADQTAVRSD